MNDQGKISLFGYIVLVVVAATSTFLGIYIVNKNKPTNGNANMGIPLNINAISVGNINATVEPTEFEKFQAIKKDAKSLTINKQRIISPQFTPDDQEANNKIALEFLRNNSFSIFSEGKISKGYLYVKAGTGTSDSVDVLAPNESVYIYLNPRGGHLFAPESLINTPSEDGHSQFLYDLRDIEFTSIPYSDRNRSYSDNWLDRFNTSGNYSIGGFVSSTKFGTIQEITFAYEGEGNLVLR